jgi:hypothetical protein
MTAPAAPRAARSGSLFGCYFTHSLKELTTIEPKTLAEAVQKLINLDAEQAKADLADVEEQLGQDALRTILIDQLAITNLKAAVAVLEKEQYSTLFRILALLVLLEDLVSSNPDLLIHRQVRTLLFANTLPRFVESRSSLVWSNFWNGKSVSFRCAWFLEIIRSYGVGSVVSLGMVMRRARMYERS